MYFSNMVCVQFYRQMSNHARIMNLPLISAKSCFLLKIIDLLNSKLGP